MRIRPPRWLPVPAVAFVVLLATCAPVLAASSLQVPPVQYRERTLANGLQVLSVEDHASPTVAVQVWYHVGSKDDPQGRSGFAHLFEHLMFKSTAHMQRRAVRPPDRGRRRRQQRLHRRRRHQLLRGGARATTCRRCCGPRPSGCPTSTSTRRTSSPSARWCEEEYRQRVLAIAVRQAVQRDRPAARTRVHPYKRPTHRQHRGPRRGHARTTSSPSTTRYYRPDNADPDRRRRLRSEAARRLGRPVLRLDPEAGRRRCRRSTAQEPARSAGPALHR